MKNMYRFKILEKYFLRKSLVGWIPGYVQPRDHDVSSSAK